MKFPNETREYRAARDALLQAEIELRRKLEAVASLRRELPAGGQLPEDYVFDSQDGEMKLSQLFSRARGWSHLRLLSSAKNTYNRDYGAEADDGSRMPMLNVFRKQGGSMRHFWSRPRAAARTGTPG